MVGVWAKAVEESLGRMEFAVVFPVLVTYGESLSSALELLRVSLWQMLLIMPLGCFYSNWPGTHFQEKSFFQNGEIMKWEISTFYFWVEIWQWKEWFNPSHVVKAGLWRKWKCFHFCGHVFFCPSSEGTAFSPVSQLSSPDVWKWPTTWRFSPIWWVITTRARPPRKWRWAILYACIENSFMLRSGINCKWDLF